MDWLRDRGRASLAALRSVLASRENRTLQLAHAATEAGSWIALIALSAVSFDDAGLAGVGIVFGLRMLPAMVAAPFMGALADRLPRRRVMIAADLARLAFAASAAGVLFVEGPLLLVYALLCVVTIASTASRPARAALLSAVARTPEELTATNAVSLMITNVASFVGPAIGGVLVAATTDDLALLVSACTYAVSAGLLLTVREPTGDAGREHERPSLRVIAGDLAEGFRTITRERSVGVLVGLVGAQVLVWGVVFVLVNGLAFDVLDTGEEGLGALLAAMGVGGVIGSLVALGLAGSRLARSLAAGVALFGAPLVVLAVWQTSASALFLVGVVGFACTLVDVSAFTLLQRAVPNDVLARVFGILESVMFGATIAGSLIAAALFATLDFDVVLLVTGLFLPLLVVVSWPALNDLDARSPSLAERLALLRNVPFLGLLPVAKREHLAGVLEPVQAEAGVPVVRQGEQGHEFYVVVEGTVVVEVDGRVVGSGGPGYYFGEIALLRGTARTATVIPRSDVELVALDRDELVSAVTGHLESGQAAAAVVAARLGAYRPAPLSL